MQGLVCHWGAAGLAGLAAETCLEGPADASANPVFRVIAGWPKSDLQLLLDEYADLHRWTTHKQAVDAGFQYGDQVYGETLNPNGSFTRAA